MKFCLLSAAFILVACTSALAGEAPARPNILWLTAEDICPNLGCYGDSYAVTPNLDRFAAQAVRYTQAFGITGVCAPNRSCLITGVFPTRLGSHGMRSTTTLPPNVKCFSEYLRERRLLLHEQRQDRLQLRRAEVGVGRMQRQRPLAQPPAGPAVLRRLQPRGLPRGPDSRAGSQVSAEHAASDAGAATRSGQGAGAAVPSRHAGGAPRLGAVLRQHHGHGLPDRRQAAGTGGRRARRGHDRVLLRRQRHRPAGHEEVDLGRRPPRAAAGPFPEEVAAPGARRARADHRPPGQLRRLRADRVEPVRSQGAGVHPGHGIPRRRRPASRASTSTRSATGWPNGSTSSASCATGVTSITATSCRT